MNTTTNLHAMTASEQYESERLASEAGYRARGMPADGRPIETLEESDYARQLDREQAAHELRRMSPAVHASLADDELVRARRNALRAAARDSNF